jgi:hypothetical protein
MPSELKRDATGSPKMDARLAHRLERPGSPADQLSHCGDHRSILLSLCSALTSLYEGSIARNLRAGLESDAGPAGDGAAEA